MDNKNLLEIRETIMNSIGATLRCTFSDSRAFEVGKNYKVRLGNIIGLPDAWIGKGNYSINGFSDGYYKVEGCYRVMARFKMIKDSKGRYVKRARITKDCLTNGDNRRLRRLARQALKNTDIPAEVKLIKWMERNAGK